MTRKHPLLALLQAVALLAFVTIGVAGCEDIAGSDLPNEQPDELGDSFEGEGEAEPSVEDEGVPAEKEELGLSDGSDGSEDDESGQGQEGAALPIASPEPLFCDHPLHDGEEWVEVEIGDLAYRFLPGTPAEYDLDRIAQTRQLVYEEIAEFLGLSVRPKVTVVLSPNRMAARHHGYAVGRAFKEQQRIEVLWPEGEGSYERERPGHELAHLLAVHLDGRFGRLAFLDEGLAEYLDGSGRDLHREYVDKLMAGQEGGFPCRMDDWDAWGMNYGRAGSFVAFLIESFGKERFFDLWRGAATTGGWAQITTLGDSVGDGGSLEAALDRLLRDSHGMGFDAIALAWEATLQPYLESAPTAVSEDDLIEMLSLVAAADRAIARSDAVAFRATLEGFYCDNWTDDEKAELARETVAAFVRVETTVVSAFPVGLRNYQEVILHTVRREVRRGEEGSLRTGMLWMEKFPQGWRISWSNAW